MDLARAWEAWQRGLEADAASPVTVRKYGIVVRLYFEFLLQRKPKFAIRQEYGYPHLVIHEKIPLKELNADNARRFSVWLRADHEFENHLTHHRKKLSINTARDYLGVLKGWGSWLEEQGILRDNPLRRVTMPRKTERVVSVLSRQDVLAMDHQIDTGRHPLRDRAMFYVLLDTGIRAQELMRIDLDDVDWEQRCILIHGKGRRERRVPVTTATITAIRKYARTPRERGGRPQSPGVSRLFLTADGLPLNYSALWRWLKRLAQRAGVAEAKLHDFRRTVATWSLEAGMDLFHVRDLLGHADIKMTQRYLSSNSEALARLHAMTSPVETLRLGRGARKREAI